MNTRRRHNRVAPVYALTALAVTLFLAACTGDDEPAGPAKVRSLVAVSGDHQFGLLGQALKPLVAEARDGAGKPVPGAWITFERKAGDTTTRTRLQADAHGQVSLTYTLGMKRQDEQVIASSGDAPPIVFRLYASEVKLRSVSGKVNMPAAKGPGFGLLAANAAAVGARVFLRYTDLTTTTTGNGTFQLNGVPTEGVKLLVEFTSNSKKYYSSIDVPPSTSETVSIAPVTVEPGANLAGTVKRAVQTLGTSSYYVEPVSQATAVIAFTEYQAKTNQYGRWAFAALPPNSYWPEPVMWAWKKNLDAQPAVPAGTVNLIDTNLGPTTVLGQVLLHGSANSAGVTVTLGDKTAVTGPDGSFSITGVAPGVYGLSAAAGTGAYKDAGIPNVFVHGTPVTVPTLYLIEADTRTTPAVVAAEPVALTLSAVALGVVTPNALGYAAPGALLEAKFTTNGTPTVTTGGRPWIRVAGPSSTGEYVYQTTVLDSDPDGALTVDVAADDSEKTPTHLAQTASTTVKRNKAPSAPGVAVAAAMAGQALTASITQAAVDPEGRALTYTYTWMRNGTAAPFATASVPAGVTLQGETWQVAVRAYDGEQWGPAGTASLVVSPIPNQAPSFTAGAGPSVLEDAGAQSVAAWATAISPGSGEAAQSVTFAVTNNNPTLFAVQPAVSPAGTLTFVPAANAFGSATVTVVVWDNGGTANGGVDHSSPQTFTIAVTPVNDLPTLAGATLGAGPVYETSTLSVTPSGFADLEGATAAYQYQWFVNGSAAAGATGPTLTGARFNRGDTVYCRVTPFDGVAAGAPVSSNTLTIQNTAPTLTSVSLGAGPFQTGDTLTPTPTGGTDADGDSVSYTYLWYVNGSTVSTAATLSSGFTAGDQVYVRATPSDGTTAGTPRTSAPVTIAGPTFTSLTPASGTAGDGFALSGSGFGPVQGASVLRVGGIVVAPILWTSTTVQFFLPANVPGGTRQVALSMGAATATTNLTVVPSITAVSAFPTVGNQLVTITGTNFGAVQGASTVNLGGVNAAVTAWSDTSITYRVPVNTPVGAAGLVVTVGGQASASWPSSVFPSITAVAPASGLAGSSVVITGANFNASQGVGTVTFSGTSASVVAWSVTSITVIVPALSPGAKNVVVDQNMGFPSNANTFTVTPHTISGVTPGSGTGGDTFTVSGSGFGATQGASTLAVGGVSVSPSAWANSTVDFVLPASIAAGTRAVEISKGGVTASTTIVVSPHLSALSATSSTVGGTVTAYGTNFGPTEAGNTLTVGGLTAAIAAWAPSAVTFTVPAALADGSHDVQLTVGGMASNTVALQTVTPAPVISGISDASTIGDQTVTVTGSYFGATQGSSTVKVAGVTAPVVSWSSSSIAFRVPTTVDAGSPGVSVTVGGRTSNTYTPWSIEPSITSITPSSGPVGTEIVVTGANFAPQVMNMVVFTGGFNGGVISWGVTSVTVTVPAVSPGLKDVFVNVNGHMSAFVPFTVTTLPTPSISLVSPASNVTAGTTVTVSGQYFGSSQGLSTLTVGGVTVTPTLWSDTSIQFPAPANVSAGNRTLTVGVFGQPTTSSTINLRSSTLYATPVTAKAGDLVTVHGANYGATNGWLDIAFQSVAVMGWSQTTASFVVPVTAPPGSNLVQVTDSAMYLISSTFVTVVPQITSFSPVTTSAASTTTLSGSNLGNTPAANTVYVGATTAPVATASRTSLTFTVSPTLTAGVYSAYVAAGGVASNTRTLAVAPHLYSVTPTAAVAGATVTLTGTGFSSTPANNVVTFGGVAATVNTAGPTSLQVTVPAGSVAGSVPVIVTTNSIGGNSMPFQTRPSITGLSPTSGSVGTVMTLSGTYFGSTQGLVTVGGLGAAVSQWYPTRVTATVPAGLAAGPKTVAVVTNTGYAATTTFSVAPRVTAASPNPVTGESTITISGNAFGTYGGSAGVTIGGVSAVCFSGNWSDTSVMCYTNYSMPGGAQPLVITDRNGYQSAATTVAVRPWITSVSPPAVAGGGTLQLLGGGFDSVPGNNTVLIGGVAASVTGATATRLFVTVPGTTAAGANRSITVSVGGYTSNTRTVHIQPRVSLVSPANATGYDTLTLTGTGFDLTPANNTITIGGKTATVLGVTSATVMTVRVPANTVAGSGVVVAPTVNAWGGITATTTIKPTISSLSYASVVSGNTLAIYGTNFSPTMGQNLITLSGAPVAASFASAGTTVSFVTPNGYEGGLKNVVVTVGGQASNSKPLGLDPTLYGVSPSSGKVGDLITLSGANFSNVSANLVVYVGGVTAAVTGSPSYYSLTFNVPPGVNTGAGTIAVGVNGRTSGAMPFTIAPKITSVSPASGTGGDTLTLSGAGFGVTQGTSTLTLAGTPVTATSWSSTQIALTIPGNLSAGNSPLRVTVDGQASNYYYVDIVPHLGWLSFSSGLPGTSVVMTGTNFGTSGTLSFRGATVSTTSWAMNVISFSVPATAPLGAASIVVTSAGYASNSMTFTVTPAAPVISDVQPSPAIGGQTVWIYGSGFGASQGGSTLKLGTKTLTPFAWADTYVTFVVPSNSLAPSAGLYDLTLTVQGVSTSFPFVIEPHITGLSPSSQRPGGQVSFFGSNFGFPATAAVVNMAGTCTVTKQGGLQCWGLNSRGEVGDGSYVNRASPVAIWGMSSGVSTVTSMDGSRCALMTDGTARCWGDNTYGQLGNWSLASASSPTDVLGLSGVKQLDGEGGHVCALFNPGTVSCWGLHIDAAYQPSPVTTPTAVAGLTSVAQVAAGNAHACARLTNGTVKCWGANYSGQLGTSVTTYAYTPILVSGLSNVAQIDSGADHTCARLNTGAVTCWGDNTAGQIGNGSYAAQWVPVTVIASGATSISAAASRSCAVMSVGSLKCWGDNQLGQPANWYDAAVTTPTLVTNLYGSVATAVAGNPCAVMTTGVVTCWGAAGVWLGSGQFGYSSVSVRSGNFASGVTYQVALGYEHTCAIMNTQRAKCWGRNQRGQLGIGHKSYRENVSDVWLNGVAQIASSFRHTCARTNTGGAWCWGENTYGQLGNGTYADAVTPTAVGGLTNGVVQVGTGWAHSCALVSGMVKCWGEGSNGELGNAMTTASAAPVTVASIFTASQLSVSGQYACALVSGGIIRCWGAGWDGELGNGSLQMAPTPVTVSGISGALQVATAWEHACAVMSDRTVRCWGMNDHGQLGDGTLTNSSTPVVVTGLSSVASVAGGAGWTCARKLAGDVVCWGYNLIGQLGNGTTIDSPTPVPVSGLTNVMALAAGHEHACAVRSGGELRCWGFDDFGQLASIDWPMTGATQAFIADSEVWIGDSPAAITSWYPDSISIRVPDITQGTYDLYIRVRGYLSNAISFTVAP